MAGLLRIIGVTVFVFRGISRETSCCQNCLCSDPECDFMVIRINVNIVS